MSTTGCECGGAPLNSGTSSCIEQITAWDYIVRVDQQTAAGANNIIPKGTTIDDVFVKAKLNNIDPTIKWTVFPKFWQIEDLRGDPLTETIDNVDFVELQGTRTFSGFHIGKYASPQMVKTWESYSCRSNAVFGLTTGGQIEGTNPDQTIGDLYPIKVEADTMSFTYMKPGKAPVKQKINIRFAVDETEKDSDLDYITSGSITYATSNWYSDAPIDVVGTSAAASTTTTLTVNMQERFGDVDKNKITGLVSADFSTDNGATTDEVFNDTTSLSVAIISVVENALIPGQYLITFALQTSTDIMRVDLFKEGLDMRTPLLIAIV